MSTPCACGRAMHPPCAVCECETDLAAEGRTQELTTRVLSKTVEQIKAKIIMSLPPELREKAGDIKTDIGQIISLVSKYCHAENEALIALSEHRTEKP